MNLDNNEIVKKFNNVKLKHIREFIINNFTQKEINDLILKDLKLEECDDYFYYGIKNIGGGSYGAVYKM